MKDYRKGPPQSNLWTYHTPNGKFLTQAAAAEGNGKTVRQVEVIFANIRKHYRRLRETIPENTIGWSRKPRKTPDPKERYMTYYNKVRRPPAEKRKEERRLKQKEKEKLSRLFKREERVKRTRLSNRKKNQVIRDKARERRKRLENRKTPEQYKESRHKYYLDVILPRTQKLKKDKEKEKLYLASQRKIKVYDLPDRNTSYQTLEVDKDTQRVFYEYHRICKGCGVDEIVSERKHFLLGCRECGYYGRKVGHCGVIKNKEYLESLIDLSKSINWNASKMGTDSATLRRHLRRHDIEHSMRFRSKKILWSHRGRRQKKPDELRSLLNDDTETQRYLPDFIEERMEALDDFFKSN